MKFTVSGFALTAACVLALDLSSVAVVTALECLTAVDPSVDYFVTKVEPTISLQWSISYHKTYKIVTNLGANETYLLVQCGSSPPTTIDTSAFAAVISIPVQSIGVDVTPTIPFLEQLGLVDNIIALTTDQSYVSSPCLLESIEQGDVFVVQTSEDLDGVTQEDVTNETIAKLSSAVVFTSPFSENIPIQTQVKINEYEEKTNAAIFEWIKFYSAFFNLEAKANEVFALAEERWDCVSAEANRVQSDSPNKPIVLWAYYDGMYCKGWALGTCPNYYCEFAQECSATLVQSDEGNTTGFCTNIYSTEQILELGATADYWIYPSDNWNETYSDFKDQLDTLKIVQDKKVFDIQAVGLNAWFEQRFAEYFAVLQDFCSIVGTTPTVASRSWFRNVLDGSEIGTLGNCTDEIRAYSIVPVKGLVCEGLEPPKAPTSAPARAPTTSSSPNLPVVGLVATLSTIVAVMMV